MIVVDTSVLVAILEREPDYGVSEIIIARAGRAVLGSANKIELMMVAGGRRGRPGLAVAQAMLDRFQIEIAPLTEAQADAAAEAFLRFGKGKHPANLNFGDCMAYAVAKSLDVPLLFKGGDFGKTDVKVAE